MWIVRRTQARSAYCDDLAIRASLWGAAIVLRIMGCDSFILSPDVIARLVAEGIVDTAPTSKRDLAIVQDAFNAWSAQSGRSLTEISQVLAFSV
mgnify:CR=1 FL=1